MCLIEATKLQNKCMIATNYYYFCGRISLLQKRTGMTGNTLILGSVF